MVSTSILRVDLSFDALSFNVTPALVLANVLIVYFLFICIQNPSIPKEKILLWSTIWVAAIVFGFTLFQGASVLQLKRYVLFIQIIAATTAFSYLFIHTADKHELFNKFIRQSFIVYCFFCAIQVIYFLQGKFFLTHEDLIPGIKLLPQTISYYFPRLSGGFIDPNVAGYFLSFLYILAKVIDKQKNLLKYFVLLNFLTLSRSAIGVMIVIVLAYSLYGWLTKPTITIRINQAIKIALSAGFALVVAVLVLVTTSVGESLWRGIEARITNKDSSTSTHIALIDFALDATLTSPKSFLVGHGFASSALYTSSFFDGNEYGNFHSEYITVFFETGLAGSFFYALIFLFPLMIIIHCGILNKYSFASLLMIISVLLQNVFYQQFLFHYYWLLILVIWYLAFEIKQDSGRKHDLC